MADSIQFCEEHHLRTLNSRLAVAFFFFFFSRRGFGQGSIEPFPGHAAEGIGPLFDLRLMLVDGERRLIHAPERYEAHHG